MMKLGLKVVKWLAQGHKVSNLLEPKTNLKSFSLKSCPISSIINLSFLKYSFIQQLKLMFIQLLHDYCTILPAKNTKHEYFKDPTIKISQFWVFYLLSPAPSLLSPFPLYIFTAQYTHAEFTTNFQFNKYSGYRSSFLLFECHKIIADCDLSLFVTLSSFNSHDSILSWFFSYLSG